MKGYNETVYSGQAIVDPAANLNHENNGAAFFTSVIRPAPFLTPSLILWTSRQAGLLVLLAIESASSFAPGHARHVVRPAKHQGSSVYV
jgi:hypothetical protein